LSIERAIMILVIVASVVLIIYIPKKRRREAIVAFLIYQAITWSVTIYIVNKGLLEFPVRDFPMATKINVTFQFLFYPTIFTLFYLNYPNEKKRVIRFLHYLVFTSIIVWFIVFIEKYTDLEHFMKSRGLKQALRLYRSLIVHFWLSHKFTLWFFKDENIKKGIEK